MLIRYKKYTNKITLMYCKSEYPAKYNAIDVAKYKDTHKLTCKYKCKFGLSDHSEYPFSDKPIETIYEDDVRLYERHFTLEKTGKQDDSVSWTIEEFAKFLHIGDEYQNRIKYKTRWI